MNGLFMVGPLEQAYSRRILFALELLDAVTLARVSDVVKVVAEGLKGQPIVNASGMFVWLYEDIRNLKKVSIDPGILPYESIEIAAEDLKTPRMTIELSPRVDYAFAAGVTGLRGTLIEERVSLPQRPIPVPNAEVHLQWLDEDDQWHDAPTVSHTNTKDGGFAAILRLTPSDSPKTDTDGKLTVRLRARRDSGNERTAADFKLLQGRVADPSTSNPLIFVWDEMQP